MHCFVYYFCLSTKLLEYFFLALTKISCTVFVIRVCILNHRYLRDVPDRTTEKTTNFFTSDATPLKRPRQAEGPTPISPHKIVLKSFSPDWIREIGGGGGLVFGGTINWFVRSRPIAAANLCRKIFSFSFPFFGNPFHADRASQIRRN